MEFTRDNVSFLVKEVPSGNLSLAAECAAVVHGEVVLRRIYKFRPLCPEGVDPFSYCLGKHVDHIIERMLWHLNND